MESKKNNNNRALAFVVAMAVLFASCGALPLDGSGGSGAGAAVPPSGAEGVSDVGDYDFSVFFGHAADAITVGRIVERYKAQTGVSIKPIMTDDGNADDRMLLRYLSASDPPAAFALSADADGSVGYAVDGGYIDPSVSDTTADDFLPPLPNTAGESSGAADGAGSASALTAASVTTASAVPTAPAVLSGQAVSTASSVSAARAVSHAGIGWRFHGRGLAADRRVLADLIGESDAGAAPVDTFVEDLRLAGYAEWSSFVTGLDRYIKGATYAAITLNGKPYSFAGKKGRYSSRLNGVFVLSGAESAFVSEWLMDLAAMTSDAEALAQSRLLTTPQAFAAISPVLDTYIDALGSYSSRIGGLYGQGVRGDDFIDINVYSEDYLHSVFSANRAVFMPLDSAEYAESDGWDATQEAQLELFPVKLPYAEHSLGGHRGQVDANSALPMSTEYSLCVNANAAPEKKAKAKAFVEWLASDGESSDAVQASLRGYHCKRAALPLWPAGEREGDTGVAGFAAVIYGSAIRQLLANPTWKPDDISAFRDALNGRWNSM